jgi:hypothetical protein
MSIQNVGWNERSMVNGLAFWNTLARTKIIRERNDSCTLPLHGGDIKQELGDKRQPADLVTEAEDGRLAGGGIVPLRVAAE